MALYGASEAFLDQRFMQRWDILSTCQGAEKTRVQGYDQAQNEIFYA